MSSSQKRCQIVKKNVKCQKVNHMDCGGGSQQKIN